MKKIKVGAKAEMAFHISKLILGCLALAVGLTGIFLPVLPGWIFIFVGLELLGIKIVFIDRLKQRALAEIENTKLKGKK